MTSNRSTSHSSAITQALKEATDILGGARNSEIYAPKLLEAIQYSLLAPGKRIRPRLCLTTSTMLGLNEAHVLPAALALEMYHCYTLIHDDLPCLDNDDMRRGRPSNHKVYGEGLALLAGDALFAMAFESFSGSASHFDSKGFLRALSRFTEMTGARGVIGGQALESALNPSSQLEDLRRMHYAKTGILFSASILVPMDLAGIVESSSEGFALTRFARELGLGFQVADDLEDAEQDLRNGKSLTPTHVMYYLPREEAARQSREALQSACDGLTKIWGERATALVSIAQEVIKSLV